MAKDDKTNVTRLLSGAKISFEIHTYDPSITDGERVAAAVGTEPNATFKTLVTVADSGKNYVFVIPVHLELDLKACGRAVGEKSIAMLPQKLLFPLTGYVHGGCSPVGMKKRLVTVIDSSCLDLPKMTLSAGKVGMQVTLSPQDLIQYLQCKTAPITRERAVLS